MVFRIRLDANKHSEFLSEQRVDPVTHEILRSGNEIIVCANHGIAFLATSWQGRCPLCGSVETLAEIPHNAISESISQTRFSPNSPISQHSRSTTRNAHISFQSNVEFSSFFLGLAIAFIVMFFDFSVFVPNSLFNTLVLTMPFVGFGLSKRFRSNWLWKWLLYNVVYHGIAISCLILGYEETSNYFLFANFYTGLLLAFVNVFYKMMSY
jgi:hypothetical protein